MAKQVNTEQIEGAAKTEPQSPTSQPAKSKPSTPKDGDGTPPEILLQMIQAICNKLPAQYRVIVSNIHPPDSAGNPGKPIASIVIMNAIVEDGMLIPAADAGNG